MDVAGRREEINKPEAQSQMDKRTMQMKMNSKLTAKGSGPYTNLQIDFSQERERSIGQLWQEAGSDRN